MNQLEKICATKREEIIAAKQKMSLHEIIQRASRADAPRGFLNALQTTIAAGKPALIAEIKKASPSKGLIRADFNPAAHAHAYQAAGATCLSVLTDSEYFQGSAADFSSARSACSLPMIRKDFMVDEYQVYESRAMGADAVLIIMAALALHDAIALESLAHDLGMDVLVEIHTRAELEAALTHLKSTLIGINNRDLKTFAVSLNTTEYLRPLIPKQYTVVCESGIHSFHDIEHMRAHHVHCFLVGESLMRQQNLQAATQKLLTGL
jgi:indole-3-glycerol phosphate synthase